ncbi:MAG: alkaline phosphatase D family protein [Polyangiaceae bacterium]|nr:alkaline phosphatase D family protein [Polyangiaceae bacterium]MCW5790416.1 alkaline phosphatase D family protein [Polyangiaceae bacterium]
MKRRAFLGISLGVAGSVVSGLGCSSDDGGGGGGAGETLTPGEAFFPQSICSGDPRPESVILWTRVMDPDQDGDLALELQVAKDEAFRERVTLSGGPHLALTAKAAHDGCVKARVTGLEPGAYYYYRFIYRKGGEAFVSRTGRTKTAPGAGSEAPVRFAVTSCQDYNGKYYHVYKHLAERDVDFFIHLGDYIYETTADPQFQTTAPGRAVTFRDTQGAIAFNEGTEEEYFAAASLDNYRELYQTYRGDQDLQRVHELFPMIPVWDDHEFSDDCYGTHATYFDGDRDEDSPERRSNADQAWFEYMPVDYRGAPEFEYDRSVNFPEDITIYRDFSFGKHLQLVMTDLRRYRPDHVVPEDVFPGQVAVTEEQLLAQGSDLSLASPYVDIASFDGGAYQAFLAEHAALTGYEAAQFAGLVSVPFINQQVTAINDSAGTSMALIDEATPGLSRGYAFHLMLKMDRYSQLGSRYLVVQEMFDAYARLRYQQTSGASEQLMGAEQEAWFLSTLRGSEATWKVWGNGFTFMPRIVDLSHVDSLPTLFRQRFRLSAEDWDGFPNKREELLEELSKLDNMVLVTGDIHAFFTGALRNQAGTGGLTEFVCSGVSSGTYQTLLVRTAQRSPTLAAAGAVGLALGVGQFLTDTNIKPNPHLAYQAFDRNGYATFELDGAQLNAWYHAITEEDVATKDLPRALERHFSTRHFQRDVGSQELYLVEGDGRKRWDHASCLWV